MDLLDAVAKKRLFNGADSKFKKKLSQIYGVWEKSIQQPWLNLIQSGIKKYEGRVYRDDWAKLQIGDTIIFHCNKLEVKTVVNELRRYTDFCAAFIDLGQLLVPGVGVTIYEVEQLYYQYFTKADIKKYGVVAVGLI
jgi:ASC-1-like (ASCH) protein